MFEKKPQLSATEKAFLTLFISVLSILTGAFLAVVGVAAYVGIVELLKLA